MFLYFPWAFELNPNKLLINNNKNGKKFVLFYIYIKNIYYKNVTLSVHKGFRKTFHRHHLLKYPFFS